MIEFSESGGALSSALLMGYLNIIIVLAAVVFRILILFEPPNRVVCCHVFLVEPCTRDDDVRAPPVSPTRHFAMAIGVKLRKQPPQPRDVTADMLPMRARDGVRASVITPPEHPNPRIQPRYPRPPRLATTVSNTTQPVIRICVSGRVVRK